MKTEKKVITIARKTFTSSAVKKRHIDKTYKRYLINLRYDTDQDIINQIEALKTQGLQTTEAIKQLIRPK